MVSYSATVGAFFFPALLSLWLLLLPFLDREDQGLGQWFGEGGCRRAVLWSTLTAVAAFGLFEAWYLGGGAGEWARGADPWMQDLLNPAALMMLLAVVLALLSGFVTGSTRAAGLAGLMVLLVALIGFTLVGLCRGPDWVFYWPWEEWPLVS